MKTFMLLFLIAVLFAIGSSDKPIFAQQDNQTEQSERICVDTTLTITSSIFGAAICQDIYVGVKLNLDKHRVVSLWSNCEGRDSLTCKPPLFSRDLNTSTEIVSFKSDDNFLPLRQPWNTDFRRTPSEYLQDLTLNLVSSESNILAARYRIVPLDRDNFILEDVQLIYRKDHIWQDIQLVIKPPNYKASKGDVLETLRYNLSSV